MRTVRLTVLVLALMAAGVPVAAADPSPDLTPSLTFQLNCGDLGIFEAINLETGIFVADTNSVFIITELSADEVGPIFSYPGLARSMVDLVTCTFVGPRTGLHFTAVGFFTPAT